MICQIIARSITTIHVINVDRVKIMNVYLLISECISVLLQRSASFQLPLMHIASVFRFYYLNRIHKSVLHIVCGVSVIWWYLWWNDRYFLMIKMFNILLIIFCTEFFHQILGYAEKYGDIFKIMIGPAPFIVISSPEGFEVGGLLTREIHIFRPLMIVHKPTHISNP